MLVIRNVFCFRKKQHDAGNARSESAILSYPACTVSRKKDTLKTVSQKLANMMEERKLYLDSELDLAMLSKAVGSNRTYLSKVLAEMSGFYVYINSLRLQHLYNILNEEEDKIFAEADYLSDVPVRLQGKDLQTLALKCGFSDLRSLRRAMNSIDSPYISKIRERIFV